MEQNDTRSVSNYGVTRFDSEHIGHLISTQGKNEIIAAQTRQMLKKKQVTVRNLAKLIWKLTASILAVQLAPLHYKHLQMASALAPMKGQNYEAPVILTKECREDLIWWVQFLESDNGRNFLKPCREIHSKMDASNYGWGPGPQTRK